MAFIFKKINDGIGIQSVHQKFSLGTSWPSSWRSTSEYGISCHEPANALTESGHVAIVFFINNTLEPLLSRNPEKNRYSSSLS